MLENEARGSESEGGLAARAEANTQRPCLVAKKKYIMAIMKDSNPIVMGEEAGKLGYEKRTCTPVW